MLVSKIIYFLTIVMLVIVYVTFTYFRNTLCVFQYYNMRLKLIEQHFCEFKLLKNLVLLDILSRTHPNISLTKSSPHNQSQLGYSGTLCGR